MEGLHDIACLKALHYRVLLSINSLRFYNGLALDVKKPTGKLGVLIPGAEAVGGTFIAGFQTIKQGI